MHLQRDREAENRTERRLLNGPRRARSKEVFLSIRDVGHTLVAMDMLVSCKSAVFVLRSKVAPREVK